MTRRWPEAAERRLADLFDLDLNDQDRPLSEQDMRAALCRYDAILPAVTDRLPAGIFDQSDLRTRILANYGVGFAHIETSSPGRGASP